MLSFLLRSFSLFYNFFVFLKTKCGWQRDRFLEFYQLWDQLRWGTYSCESWKIIYKWISMHMLIATLHKCVPHLRKKLNKWIGDWPIFQYQQSQEWASGPCTVLNKCVLVQIVPRANGVISSFWNNNFIILSPICVLWGGVADCWKIRGRGGRSLESVNESN